MTTNTWILGFTSVNLKVKAIIKDINEKVALERVKELEEEPWDIFPGEKTQLTQANPKPFF